MWLFKPGIALLDARQAQGRLISVFPGLSCHLTSDRPKRRESRFRAVGSARGRIGRLDSREPGHRRH